MGLAIRSEEEANDIPKVQKQNPNKIQTTIDTKKCTIKNHNLSNTCKPFT